MDDGLAATAAGVPPARPATVLAAAMICFVEAAFCGLGMLAGIVIMVLGLEAHGAGTGSALLIGVGLLIAVPCLVMGVLYLLGGRGLLRRNRPWYLAVLVLLTLTAVVGVLGFAAQRTLWDLLWPAVDVVTLGVLIAPRSRAYLWWPPP